MTRKLLTLNAGSSSLKAALFEVDDGLCRRVMKAHADGLGVSPRFTVQDASGGTIAQIALTGAEGAFEAVMARVLAWADSTGPGLWAVGHRVVHGGRDHVGPEQVTSALLLDLDRLCSLAPLHQPHNLAPIRAIAAARPDLPQVACFDTAFHATMPPVATRFALPRVYEAAGVRRYGFHGLSYDYIAGRLTELDPVLAAGRVIVAHLGAGASLCAMQGGRSIDTTMGFTALDGLMMGTRCGALDPGVVLHLQRQMGLSAEAVEDILYKTSGLLGVSGLSSDMRVLQASDDPHAAEAVELFVYRIAREAGGLVSSLGGLDGVVFTAGIGENAPEIRAQVCERLAWLGLKIDPDANLANRPVISAPHSRVTVRVLPTDEEAMIAAQTLDALAGSD